MCDFFWSKRQIQSELQDINFTRISKCFPSEITKHISSEISNWIRREIPIRISLSFFQNTFRIPIEIYVRMNIFIRSRTEIPIGILNEISFNGSSPARPGSSSNHDDAAEDNVD